MKFKVQTDYLAPIEIDKYEHVTVVLPDGRSVTVFADHIRVQTGQDAANHRSGKRIWDAMSPQRTPYGKTRSAGEGS